jgi:hypothetical protein
MSWSDLVPSLMFMTIGLVLLYAIWQFAMFLRKRRNREIAAHAFTGDPAADPGSPQRPGHPER